MVKYLNRNHRGKHGWAREGWYYLEKQYSFWHGPFPTAQEAQDTRNMLKTEEDHWRPFPNKEAFNEYWDKQEKGV